MLGCGFRPDFDIHPNNSSHSLSPNRIVGSKDALPGEWPWTVSLQVWGQPFCGGSILNTWWILSAAHCFEDDVYRSKNLRVEVGATILKKKKEALEVEKIINHPWYGIWYFDHDIALLLLTTPIQFNVLKTPICLPPAGDLIYDNWHTCYVTGWGTLVAGHNVPHKYLQKVEMVLIKHSTCQDWYFTLTWNMLCAGYEEGGRDPCQGDSGGPLVCKYWKDNLWYEVGIVSWGKGCGRRQRPGVYTVVSKYVNWIIKETAAAGKPYVPDEQRESKEEEEEDEEDEFNFSTSTTSSVTALSSPTRTITPTRSPTINLAITTIRSTSSSSSTVSDFIATTTSSTVQLISYQNLLNLDNGTLSILLITKSRH